jgi:hypothetical protein
MSKFFAVVAALQMSSFFALLKEQFVVRRWRPHFAVHVYCDVRNAED